MTKQPYFRTIDMNGVPVPAFVEAFSFEEIRAAAISHLKQLEPDYIVLESDPAIKVIEAFAYREMLLRQRINDAARANTLTEARGNDLDVIGAFVNVARLPDEHDERYRKRIQQGLAALAAAGPRNAYIAHTMAVSKAIIDVSVDSPAPGDVIVSVLAFDDVEDATAEEKVIGHALFGKSATSDKTRILVRPSSPILQAARERLNENDIRPLTDNVMVRAPAVVDYTIAAKLVIYPGPDGAAVKSAALARLGAYLQSVRRIAYAATRAGITAALAAPGVQNVILAQPQHDITSGPHDLAVASSVMVEVDRVST